MNPIINLIKQQASATPENIAVVYNQVNYTYRDVMAQASGIAQQVSQAGLVQEDVVGILIPRSQWLAIAPLGVLAAGCAYMPLDPAYPAERLNFMLSDSRAKLLIADREVLAESGLTVDDGYVETENARVPVLYTDNLQASAAPSPITHHSSPITQSEIGGEALALLIYTSGSAQGLYDRTRQHQLQCPRDQGHHGARQQQSRGIVCQLLVRPHRARHVRYALYGRHALYHPRGHPLRLRASVTVHQRQCHHAYHHEHNDRPSVRDVV